MYLGNPDYRAYFASLPSLANMTQLGERVSDGEGLTVICLQPSGAIGNYMVKTTLQMNDKPK